MIATFRASIRMFRTVIATFRTPIRMLPTVIAIFRTLIALLPTLRAMLYPPRGRLRIAIPSLGTMRPASRTTRRRPPALHGSCG
jgi:hypothetical protein